ncbi:hypothetical protein HDU92_007925 [Lobulomyces angularis]|nr:hypothetical protein HDU92_007925 [Lobulomyces angularis]
MVSKTTALVCIGILTVLQIVQFAFSITNPISAVISILLVILDGVCFYVIYKNHPTATKFILAEFILHIISYVIIIVSFVLVVVTFSSVANTNQTIVINDANGNPTTTSIDTSQLPPAIGVVAILFLVIPLIIDLCLIIPLFLYRKTLLLARAQGTQEVEVSKN